MHSDEDTRTPAVRWEDVAAYVHEELLPHCTPPILETTPLISSGLLDSYSVVELIAHVETRFHIEVAPAWYRLEHLDTLENIVQTIQRIQRERSSNCA
jgi:acyl carrier protein